ncbi:MAG: hypothetical protein VX745_01955 [Pseudomonadota bacterium]|nr:hypothetical protein [Pseudomonadota bacterium]
MSWSLCSRTQPAADLYEAISVLVLFGMSLLLVNFMLKQVQLQAETVASQAIDPEHALSSAQ